MHFWNEKHMKKTKCAKSYDVPKIEIWYTISNFDVITTSMENSDLAEEDWMEG